MVPPTYEAPPICDTPLLQRSSLTHLGSSACEAPAPSKPAHQWDAPPILAPPLHLHSALPSRTPLPAAPPTQAPPRVPAPSFRLARTEWAERAVLSGGAAGGVHWLPSTRSSAVSGLFAMDHNGDPSVPRASFRKFLEQLSGAGKAIGVLTSGGDAQGALPPPRAGAEGDIGEKGWRYQGENVETRSSDRGTGRREMWESSPVPGSRRGTLRGLERAGQPPSPCGGTKGGVWQPRPSSGR